MTDVQNGQHIYSLPEELQLALHSATWRALTAMSALRIAVRNHVYDECGRGLCQSDIDEGLRSMIFSSGPALDNVDYSAERIDDVTRQVMKWSAAYYQRPR